MEDVCSICGHKKKVASRNPTLCFNCYNKEHVEKCNICGKIKPVNVRKNGLSICQECNRKKDICSNCKEYKKIKFVSETEKLCGNCRSKTKKEKCSICLNIKIVVSRVEGNPICGECYKELNKKKCLICGKFKRIKSSLICENCYNNKFKKGTCSKCKKYKILHYSDNTCFNCYTKNRFKNDLEFRIKTLFRKRFKNKYKNICKKHDDIIDYEKCFEKLGAPPGDGYHIDHIFPLCAFDFNNIIEIKIAWCPENLEWLKAEDNLKKGSKFDKEELIKFKEFIIDKYKLKK